MPNTIATNLLRPGKYQPRRKFSNAANIELQNSIKANGIIQAITARRVDDHYEIICGERRWRAACAIGLEEVPVLILVATDAEAARMALLENIERENMTPIEEAEGAAGVLTFTSGDREEAAKLLGWSRSKLEKRLALMNCSEAVRQATQDDKIPLGIAELLAAVSKTQQDKTLTKIIEQNLTVSHVKQALQHMSGDLVTCIFPKEECAQCQFNSGMQRVMFGEAIDEGRCTNLECYNRKIEDELQSRVQTLKDEYPVVRIARSGENNIMTKLKVENIGPEQFSKCKGCANYGAAVSAVPGKIGGIFKDICFETSCHDTLVAQFKKATTQASAQKKEPGANSQKSENKEDHTKVGSISQKVKEYRVKQWRKALSEQLRADLTMNEKVLIATCATGSSRYISSTTASHSLQEQSAQGEKELLISLTDALKACESLTDPQMQTVRNVITDSIVQNIDESKLIEILNWSKTDFSKYWKIDEEFLTLLTKSEIEYVVTEVKLTQQLGSDIQKIFALKKPEIIAKIIGIPDVNFVGLIPGIMLWNNKAN